MALTPECIAAVQEASGGRWSAEEAATAIQRLIDRKKALVAEGKTADLDRRLVELAAEDADRAKIAAALARKHAALNAIVRDRLEDLITLHVANGLSYPDAVLAILEGVNRNIQDGRLSVANVQRGFESKFIMDMHARIQSEVPEAWKLFRQKAFKDDIVREMEQIKPGGKPGITNNSRAQKVAAIYREFTDLSRADLISRGANIGKLPGWAGPHRYNGSKMIKGGKDQWSEDIFNALDLERSFPELTPDEVMGVVRDIYDTIITGRDNRLTAREKGDFISPPNVAKSISRHRVLHFKDADAWLSINEKYGDGHIVDGIYHHQRHAARIAAQMQMLGPNPDVMMGSLLERLQRRVRNDPKIKDRKKEKIIRRLNLEEGHIGWAMAEMHGLTTIPEAGNVTGAMISSDIRAVMTMAKLGSSVFSQFNDLVIGASALRYNGVPLGRAYYEQFKALLRGRTPAEQKELAFLAGEYGDGLIGRSVNRFSPDDMLPGAFTRAQNTFFRWNQMTWFTDTARGAMGRTLSAHLGRQTGRRFGNLKPELQREFSKYGIGEADWDIIRRGNFRNVNGNKYVTADRIRQIEGVDAKALDDIELKFRTYMTDQIMSGIIQPDARTRRWMLRGTRPGTLYGEIARFFWQFKGFPMAYVERPLGRAFAKGTPMPLRIWSVFHLIAFSTVAGYVSMIAKDYLRGYEPRDPTDEEYWHRNWGAAFMQGGGLGIFGDFLFGEARHSQGALETLSGPALGTGSQALRMMWKLKDGDAPSDTDWFNMLAYNTPGGNLWWARAAGLNEVLDAIREGMDPGYTLRRDARRMEEFGQRPL